MERIYRKILNKIKFFDENIKKTKKHLLFTCDYYIITKDKDVREKTVMGRVSFLASFLYESLRTTSMKQACLHVLIHAHRTD